MTKPVIEYQREIILRKILKIPDRRFKSGYREHKIVAVSQVIIPEGMTNTTIQQTHLLKNGKFITMSEVFGQATFTIDARERELN